MIDDDTQTCPPPNVFDTLDPDVRRRFEDRAQWVEHVLKLRDDFGVEALIGVVHVINKEALQQIAVFLLATRHDATRHDAGRADDGADVDHPAL